MNSTSNSIEHRIKSEQTAVDQFETAFFALTGRNPFPWQTALFARLRTPEKDGIPDLPTVASIPTGLGKTSVLAVWLIALSQGALLPRRLVYVVNRRTVVDQTTREAERLKAAVDAGKLPGIDRLAISTLRGQYADNGDWSADPSQPAVICGTVDMIGSRLLFAGYRIGFKSRPLHAAFLGQDALLIHDEAHLEPAFQQLVSDIESEQQRERDSGAILPWPRLRVMALSATARNQPNTAPFTLTEEERTPPEVLPDVLVEPLHHVWRRLKATKTLRLHVIDEEKKQLTAKIVDLSFEHHKGTHSILLFLRSVKDVEQAASALRKRLKDAKLSPQVATLTGTMRGLERDVMTGATPIDGLVDEHSLQQLQEKQRIFARFLPESDRPPKAPKAQPAEGPVFLICTSAGEVGVNLSADHMICDLSTFDSMAQRLGRVNRFGDREDTRVDVVVPKSFATNEKKRGELEARRQQTLELLQSLERKQNPDGTAAIDMRFDASPLALTKLDAAKCGQAFAPEPHIPRATDILFDAWAMTSIRTQMPGRPPVAPYLHGVAEWEPPRTSIAWREEVEAIKPAQIEREGREFLRELLTDYALKPHELLSDTSDRVYTWLQILAKRLGHGAEDIKAWIVDDHGQVEPSSLTDLLETDKQQTLDHIKHQTLILPPSAGGLSAGILDGSSAQASDVADLWIDDHRDQRRARRWGDQDAPKGMALIRTIDTDPDAEEETISETEADDSGSAARSRRRFWHWFARPKDADNPTHASPRPIAWRHHTDDVVDRARDILAGLNLPQSIHQALELAAEWHDLGKMRELWQRSIGNPDPRDWHAKPGKPEGGRPWRPRHISDYRHEFGSLLDVLDTRQLHHERLGAIDPDLQDLALHLIAAHHGRARPHFTEDEVADPDHSQSFAEEVAIETMRRYARLQRRYGRWGLAYLESLLRAADWAASANPSTVPEHEETTS